MFGGVTYLSIDPKNRLSIPSRYKEELQAKFMGRLVITLESPQCLLIYPEETWLAVRDKIQNLPTSSHPLVKSYQRLVLGYAEMVELDKAGRVLLPNTLKQLAKLDKEVVLVGIGSRFELWDSSEWSQETKQALELSQADLAGLLNGLTL